VKIQTFFLRRLISILIWLATNFCNCDLNYCPSTIVLQGPTRKKTLAYKRYDAEEVILGKKWTCDL
jgi:hypothetical protein